MNIGFLIPLSIDMGLAGLAAFFWALRHGQFNDPDGDACRILIPQPPAQDASNEVRIAKPGQEDSGRG